MNPEHTSVPSDAIFSASAQDIAAEPREEAFAVSDVDITFESDSFETVEDAGEVDSLDSVVDEKLEDASSVQSAAHDSADEDTEEPKPVRDLREHLRSLPGDWYVIHTYSGHERRVQDNLMQRVKNAGKEDEIFEVQVPDEYILEYRGTQKKRVRHVRIPGYVIVCMDFSDDTYRIVKDTTAVTGFVGDQHNPVPLSEDEVVMLLTPNVMEAAAAEDKTMTAPVQQIQVDFQPGEIVTVTDGAFAETTAVISEVKPETRKLKVLVTLFERQSPR